MIAPRGEWLLSSRTPRGEVAQLVEHTTENRSVDGSIPPLATFKPFPFTDLARLDFSASGSVFAFVTVIVPASACNLRDASAAMQAGMTRRQSQSRWVRRIPPVPRPGKEFSAAQLRS
jgi:hypothetical protein